jgi:hypothetical protein
MSSLLAIDVSLQNFVRVCIGIEYALIVNSNLSPVNGDVFASTELLFKSGKLVHVEFDLGRPLNESHFNYGVLILFIFVLKDELLSEGALVHAHRDKLVREGK